MRKRKHPYGRCEAKISPWPKQTGYMQTGFNPLGGPRRCRRSATHYYRGLYVCETHGKLGAKKNPAHTVGGVVQPTKLTAEFVRNHLLP